MQPFVKNFSKNPIRKCNSLIFLSHQVDLTSLTATTHFEERIQKVVESYIKEIGPTTKSVRYTVEKGKTN